MRDRAPGLRRAARIVLPAAAAVLVASLCAAVPASRPGPHPRAAPSTARPDRRRRPRAVRGDAQGRNLHDRASLLVRALGPRRLLSPLRLLRRHLPQAVERSHQHQGHLRHLGQERGDGGLQADDVPQPRLHLLLPLSRPGDRGALQRERPVEQPPAPGRSGASPRPSKGPARATRSRFKGWLVSYGVKGAPYARGSSTVRNDRGNGACEVVYVTEFEILREANPVWRSLYRLSLVLGGLALAVLIFL